MRSASGKQWAKRLLLGPARFFNGSFAYMTRVDAAFSRGTLGLASRRLDPMRPSSWEFGAFSQNGEDGVIEHLLSLVAEPNRYFLEIGASDGLQNNCSHLAFTRSYDGIMVEADRFKSVNAKRFLQSLNWAVRYLNLLVEPESAQRLLDECLHRDPDFLSLDIDSNDYFVMRALLEAGARPKVACVEYNSAFGPDLAASIAYTPGLDYRTHHPSQLYYGVSISGWRALFEQYGYRFVTVESRGINAFFIDSSAVQLPEGVVGTAFAENATQLCRHRTGWEGQFAQIRHLPLHPIPAPEPGRLSRSG